MPVRRTGGRDLPLTDDIASAADCRAVPRQRSGIGVQHSGEEREPMIETIERMLTDLERCKLTRREFAVSTATLAAGSLAAPGALAASPA
jgi:hypothetical protein